MAVLAGVVALAGLRTIWAEVGMIMEGFVMAFRNILHVVVKDFLLGGHRALAGLEQIGY